MQSYAGLGYTQPADNFRDDGVRNGLRRICRILLGSRVAMAGDCRLRDQLVRRLHGRQPRPIPRGRKAELRYFLDHSCDAVATVLIIGGIGASPFVRLDVALFAAIGYLLLSIHTFLGAKVSGDFKLSYLAAGPTELRLMLIALTLAMLLLGQSPDLFGQISGFDLFVGSVGTLLMILFVVQTSIVARRLGRLDP
jgi:hypothetical protein